MPTLVHGVDISTLEGWMVKINSNPSLFGKSFSRRWFRVSFVPAGSDQKLIISYSTNKTSKEPRGWLYIEDISGVYCRRDMIEVVSPARTLRFKGETAVEHRLWSDSLHKLCNPPKPKSTAEIAEEKRLEAERAALQERQREQLRSQDRDRIADPKKTREFVDSQRSSADEAKEPSASRKSPVEMASPRDHAPPSVKRREPAPEQRDPRPRCDRRKSSSDDEREDDRGSSDEDTEDDEPPRRRQSQERHQEKCVVLHRQHDSSCDKSSQKTSSRRSETARPSPREDYEAKHNASDDEEEDDDDDEDTEPERRRASQGTLAERRPSLLVASIKSLSPVVAPPKATSSKPTHTMTASMPSRESSPLKCDANTARHSNEHDDDGDSPQHESPRGASVSVPVVVAKTKSTDEDDSDEETNNTRRPTISTAQATSSMVKTPPTTQMSEIRADNNFADDDWDVEEPTPAPRSKQRDASPEKRASVGVGFGGVTADSNFATEDWD